tara:strand:+ start:138 stop:689 length:552 start_codon:yes stop_codon:yes gene_type:complete
VENYSYSQIGQDLEVLKHTKNKKNGTFVDIGCYCPIDINNTYLLEKKYGWSGISIDLFGDYSHEGSNMQTLYESWETERPGSCVIKGDAVELDYAKLFKENNLPFEIDYLTLDLEPPMVTFEALKKLPLDTYTFGIVTFEHDGWRMDKEFIEQTRAHFKSYGYTWVKDIRNQDDVYIHESIQY